MSRTELYVVTKRGCPACEKIGPQIPKLTKAVRAADIPVIRVNADADPKTVRSLGVHAFPEFVLKRGSKKVAFPFGDTAPTARDIAGWVSDIRAGKDVIGKDRTFCARCGTAGGIDPRIWGPPLWFVIHLNAMLYPTKPTATDRRDMRAFFRGLRTVLPCDDCKRHYGEALDAMKPRTVFKSRDTLFAWTVELHNAVTTRVSGGTTRLHGVEYWKRHYKSMVSDAIGKKRTL